MCWLFAGLALVSAAVAALLLFKSVKDQAALSGASERSVVLGAEAAGLRDQIARLGADLVEARGRAERAAHGETQALATLAAEQRGAQEKLALLEQARDTFARLSRDALEQNNAAFLARAKAELQLVQAEGKGELDLRQKAIEALVAPLQQSLCKVDGQIQSLEKDRAGAYAALGQQIQGLLSAQQQLSVEAGKLAGALTSSNVRGNWGQLQLRRVLELADLAEHLDFDEQMTLASGDRPDVVVHLAGNREIAVDAKVPMQAFLDALAATSEDQRTASLKEHAQQLRARVNELSAKGYWAKLPRSLDLVVLFLPSESLFQAAMQFDERLLEDAFHKKVVFATPLTLLALLRTVALGWREERMAQSAELISQNGKELYERMRHLAEHLNKVGAGLGKAVEAYNHSVGSLERQLLPAARRFKELGAGGAKDLEPIERLQTEVRPVTAAELTPDPRAS